MNKYEPIVNLISRELVKRKHAYSVILNEDYLRITQDIDPVLRAHIIRFYATVWGDAEPFRHYEFSKPKTWWDAFKERWFPQWLLKRYPVEYIIETVDVNAIYPDFRPAIPNDEYRLVINSLPHNQAIKEPKRCAQSHKRAKRA